MYLHEYESTQSYLVLSGLVKNKKTVDYRIKGLS